MVCARTFRQEIQSFCVKSKLLETFRKFKRASVNERVNFENYCSVRAQFGGKFKTLRKVRAWWCKLKTISEILIKRKQ